MCEDFGGTGRSKLETVVLCREKRPERVLRRKEVRRIINKITRWSRFVLEKLV
jgi:hypothetical protein